MDKDMLIELETGFKSVPIEKIEEIMNLLIERIAHDPHLEKNTIPVLQDRIETYKVYIAQRKKEQADEFKKSGKVIMKKPLTD